MMSDGWIKLHRALLSWEWYTTPNMVHFWIHCLLLANHEDGFWRGIQVKKGQFISGRKSLSANTGLSEQQVRTCIDRLKSTNELTSQSTNEYTIFTIISWEKYQITESSNQQDNQRATSEQPASNQPSTTNKNDKNDKNDKKYVRTQFFPPTLPEAKEWAEASELYGFDVEAWHKSRTATEWKKANGKKVKDWKLDIRGCIGAGSFIKQDKPYPIRETNQERINRENMERLAQMQRDEKLNLIGYENGN